MNNQIIKIFLASSSELKEDRQEFEILINRQNQEYIKQNIFLELVLWENFLDAMSQTRLQDEYNKIMTECDIVVSLFKTKVGQYTEEEVMKAYETFKKNNKPLIYTYFKEAQIDVSTVNLENLQSLQDFKNKLSDLGHFYTTYKNIEDLKFQFSQQLIKLIPTLTNIQDEAEVKTVPTEENLGKKSKSGNTRLEKKLEMLNEQWEIASEILQELNKALVIEADVMRKFQLQKQIEDRENELDQLEKEIEEIENKLE